MDPTSFTGDLPGEKGSYILFISLDKDVEITAGRLKTRIFNRGFYAYTGSALGGLKGRVARHLAGAKKMYWHIDYLLREASVESVITCLSEKRIECELASAIAGRYESVDGFGSSDCNCRSHLFYSSKEMVNEVAGMLESIGFNPQCISKQPVKYN